MKLQEKIKNAPSDPGCYIFRNSKNEVIYIGKAKNLKKRISNYFQNKDHDEKTRQLVLEIADLDWIITDNEIEALLLEAKLIRTHKPKYNIDLKETLRYAYLKITDETFPRIVTARTADGKGKIFGPFTSGKARQLGLKLSNRIFKLRICDPMPRKACLLFHLGQCTAPCIGNVDETEYRRQVNKAETLLKGKNKELLEQLDLEMRRFAKSQQYERAQEVKEQIKSIQHLSEKQKIDLPKLFDQNVLNFIESENKLHIQVFQVQKGVVAGKKSFSFEGNNNDFSEFVRQYYISNPLPKEIIIPEAISDQPLLEIFFSRLKNERVRITVPKTGYKKGLLQMVEKNILHELNESPVQELSRALKSDALLNEIDCFDISNISGTFAVGSCVRFTQGKPNKSLYRKFKIKYVRGINDFAMMKEVVARRYLHEKIALPDLILIDGGKGQLSSAVKALEEIGKNIPIASLAKKLEEIYLPSTADPIRLPMESKALSLVRHLRDEAHRFAITYHRNLRSKPIKDKK